MRQRKPFRRKDGLVIYFEDNAGVIVNPKGEIKGAHLALAAPACFAADLGGPWPESAANFGIACVHSACSRHVWP